MPPDAVLSFSDGTIFYGTAAGATGVAVGEVIFNTAMSGYQEILTDPSYCRQIINFTHPHIGNTGVNRLDDESPRIFAAALVARKISKTPASWRAQQSLPDFLKARKTPAIEGVDTRAITRKIRDGGALAACVASVGEGETIRAVAEESIARARAFSDGGGLNGAMLANIGEKETVQWRDGLWTADNVFAAAGDGRWRVVVLDCGLKRNILRHLIARRCRVVVMPYESDWAAIAEQKPHGVLFSNGPGDPAPCENAEKLAREFIKQKTPIFGICLGHQIIAAALGAKTYKMNFGHHGANHPVRDEKSGRVLITSQNHSFAVDKKLPPGIVATHISLFDGSLQGIASDTAMTFQGHPEAAPGPADAAFLFDNFIALIEKRNLR